MLFILGSAYQGLIISLIIAQDEPQNLKSFDDVLDNGLSIATGTHFHNLMYENKKYQEAFRNGRVKIAEIFMFNELYKEHVAYIAECDDAKYKTENELRFFFYMIDEKMFSYYSRLQVVYLHKYLRRWQLLMDFSFEAGLPQAWKKFEQRNQSPRRASEKANFKLDNIFYAAIVGFLVSPFALMCEIFWHDAVS